MVGEVTQSPASAPTIPPIFVGLVDSFVIFVEPRRLMTHSPGPLIHCSVQVFDAIPPPVASKQEGVT